MALKIYCPYKSRNIKYGENNFSTDSYSRFDFK